MVCRNPKYAEEAMTEIKDASKNDNIFIHILDLSDTKAVVKFANEFDQSVQVLINNAGCMVNERTMTESGLEKNFATNTLGTHILTERILKNTKLARVIIVSSGGMLTNKLDVSDFNFEKMNPFDGTMAYAQNKRQQVVMTQEYGKRYPDTFFASMHPGEIYRSIFESSHKYSEIFALLPK